MASNTISRKARQLRVRKKIVGTAEKPRLNVYRSSKHISVQLIDDESGKTLVAASTLEPSIKAGLENTGNIEAAKAVGKAIGERAVEKGHQDVVFDRAGYLYHGRVKALAESAREAGLRF